MSSALARPPLMDVDQFLAWSGDGVTRLHQLIDGEPVAMAPPSWVHGVIVGALARLLGNHLEAKNSPCRVAVEPGVQPRAGTSTNVRVPDVAVACRPVSGYWMLDPVLIVEILSASNVRETREAVRAYLTVPSVMEVLVVDSRTIRAEMIRRHPDGTWPAEPLLLGEGDDVVSESLGFRCALAALYPP